MMRSVSSKLFLCQHHGFSIIANRVGAESYENFSDDNMLNFKYEGTIRRQSGDLLRAVFFHVYLISESQCDTLIMNVKP